MARVVGVAVERADGVGVVHHTEKRESTTGVGKAIRAVVIGGKSRERGPFNGGDRQSPTVSGLAVTPGRHVDERKQRLDVAAGGGQLEGDRLDQTTGPCVHNGTVFVENAGGFVRDRCDRIRGCRQ
jgi:hypothetical protein